MTAATDAPHDDKGCTEPDDVECSDADVFPCFPCYLSGRASLPTNTKADVGVGDGGE